MQKLSSRKKGFSLIEQLCALAIFGILCASIISLELNNIRLKNYNKEIMLYTNVMEALKQEILYNCSYDNLKAICNSDKRYILNNKLTIENIRSNNLDWLLDYGSDLSNTYLIMNITDGEVLRVHMEIHVNFKYKQEILEYEFNKGNYI